MKKTGRDSKRKLRVSTSSLLCLWLTACGSPPSPITAEVLRQRAETQHEIYQALASRAKLIQSLRGRVRLVKKKGLVGWDKTSLVLLVQRPLELRVDTLSPLGAFDLQVANSAGGFTVLWPQQNRYFSGLGSRSEVDRWLGLEVSIEEMIGLLLAQPPLEGEEYYRMRQDRDSWILEGPRTRIRVQQKRGAYLPVHLVVLNFDGDIAYQVFYEEHALLAGSFFPRKIEFQEQKEDEILILSFIDLELNPPLGRDLFRIEIPHEAEQIFE